MTPDVVTPEFSRIKPIERDMGAGDDAERFSIEATAGERAALAQRFGLIEIGSLTATGTIDVSARGRRARLTATLHARVIQPCVVTLQPVPAEVEDCFTMTYDRDAGGPAQREESFDLDADDPPDPLPEAGIDIGEAVAEHLGLALEPYPRAPGVEFRPESGDGNEAGPANGARPSPFAALARLRRRENPGKS